MVKEENKGESTQMRYGKFWSKYLKPEDKVLQMKIIATI